MEAAVFILSLVDCCALIFLSVYFVSFFPVCSLASVELIHQAGQLAGSSYKFLCLHEAMLH